MFDGLVAGNTAGMAWIRTRIRQARSWWAPPPVWPAPGEASIIVPDELVRERQAWARLLAEELEPVNG